MADFNIDKWKSKYLIAEEAKKEPGLRDSKENRAGAQQVRRRMITKVVPDTKKNFRGKEKIEEKNAFLLAADAAKDAGQKKFEFPKGSGRMHNVTMRTNITVNEDLDLGHIDDEPHMIKGELYKIGKYAMELYQMVDQFEGQGEVDFPAWWQSKITKACVMISAAKHYLEFELTEPEIDAAVRHSEDITGYEN